MGSFAYQYLKMIITNNNAIKDILIVMTPWHRSVFHITVPMCRESSDNQDKSLEKQSSSWWNKAT